MPSPALAAFGLVVTAAGLAVVRHPAAVSDLDHLEEHWGTPLPPSGAGSDRHVTLVRLGGAVLLAFGLLVLIVGATRAGVG